MDQVNEVKGKAPEQALMFRATVAKLNPAADDKDPREVMFEGIGVATFVNDGKSGTNFVACGTIDALTIVRGLLQAGTPADRIITVCVDHIVNS